MIENPTELLLPPAAKPLLRALFVEHKRVIVQSELSGGLSGSRVLLVRPVGPDGRPELPAVVKIAPAGLIEAEWQAYQNHIQHKLLGIAEVRGKPVAVTQGHEQWGGICYPLLGGGEFDIESLFHYCQHVDADDVLYVLQQRLFPSLETLWRYNVPAPAFHLRGSYDHLLPVNIRLKPVDKVSESATVRTLRPGSTFAPYPEMGDYVCLEDFVVTEVEPVIAAVTLNLPRDEPSTMLKMAGTSSDAYRVRLQPVRNLDRYKVGERVLSVVGQVTATRPVTLHALAQQTVGDTVALDEAHLPSPPGHNFDLPNPLLVWPDILNVVRDVKVADIHGDFNLENVLVDPETRDVRLIDFALARRDHVLHDLLRMETEIVTKLLPESLVEAGLPGTTVSTLYMHLHTLLAVDADASATALPEAVKWPLTLLKTLRALARDYLFRRGDWSEYYQGLTLYLLSALKFKNLDQVSTAPLPKQVAFWAAATACALQAPALPQPTETPVYWSQVEGYFPPQRQPMPAQASLNTAHINHLCALLHAVLTYLPRNLALDILEQRPSISGCFVDGTLLFADISGFTALSEALRHKGGIEGAEELVRIINQYLDVMLAILFQYDGELLRFGGDAMLCLFTDAASAVRAAWAMKQAMAEQFAEVIALQEVFPLGMKVGCHSGQLFSAQVGTADHKEYVLTGSAVEQTAHAEAAAQRGDILISRETHAEVQVPLEVAPLAENVEFLRVVALKTTPAESAPSPAGRRWDVVEHTLRTLCHRAATLLQCLDRATVYLPTGILSQLVLNPVQEQLEGQHRRVTVVFANLIGMPDIINARGPEDAAGIAGDLGEYFETMLEEVQYYGGMVNKVDLYDQGDKIIILFGAPLAHEQDVHRAALTALAIQETLHRLTSPIASALLSQRIGIHTGYVFAGNVGSAICRRREYTVMGNTVNLAARLMSKAPVGHIWISDAVQEELGTAFEVEALPPASFKGVSGPTPVYRLHGVQKSKLTRHSRLLRSQLVGRAAELEALLTYLADSAQGLGKQVIAVVGEAGVGKTRLLMEWQQSASQALPELACIWLHSRGRPYGQQTHGIWRDVLIALLGWQEQDDQEMRWYKLSEQLKKVFAGATGWFEGFTAASAYLGHFLGLDLTLKQGVSERVARLEASTLQIQTRLAVCDLLTATARERPLILVLDDLHWADEASLDLLHFVLDHLDDRLPILLCLSYRLQKERPIWQMWQTIERTYPDAHQMILQELPGEHIQALLHNLLPEADLSEDFQNMMLHATDGNPLYIEEVLHSLIEDEILLKSEKGWQCTQPIMAIRVPASLQQIIQERIDELDYGSPGARRVLWMASVIGDIFREDLLVHLFTESGRSRAELQRHLRELRNAALVDRHSEPPESGVTGFLGSRRYYFQHGLVRRVAYENTLLSTRRRYHQVVGTWLEQTFADSLEAYYDDLAHHYEQACCWDKAYAYHNRAGKRDAQAYANQQAVAHFQSALACTVHLTQEGDTLASTHFALGKVLALQGNFDTALAHLTQADELWAELAGTERARARARVCYHIGRLYEQRGGEENLATALQWCIRGVSLLPEASTAEAAQLHLLSAAVASRRADWAAVVRESQRALDVARVVADRSTVAGAHRMLARVAWGRGALETALAHCEQSLKIHQAIGDLVNIAKDHANQGILTEELGDWHAARYAYQEALALQERMGDQYQIAVTVCNLGNLLCRLGELASGIAHTQRGLAIFEALDAVHGVIFAHAVLATLFFQQGDLDTARAELLTARGLIMESGAKELAPTVGRWLAEVYLAEDDIPRTAAELRQLLAIGAEGLDTEAEPIQRLWARLLAKQGRSYDAYRVLKKSLARLEQQKHPYEIACTLDVLADVTAKLDRREADAYSARAQVLFAALRGE